MNAMLRKTAWVALLCSLVATGVVSTTHAADKEAKADNKFVVADGKLTFVAPEKWEKRQPKTNIVEHEFSIPAEEGDKEAGRMTVMGAGGSIEANIDRWYGQFVQADGSDTKEASGKPEAIEVGDSKVVIVDIKGTFLDTPGGPFARGKVVERPDYRMLAAIVSTKQDGNYFLKFYGPAKTVEAYAEGFTKMVKELEHK